MYGGHLSRALEFDGATVSLGVVDLQCCMRVNPGASQSDA